MHPAEGPYKLGASGFSLGLNKHWMSTIVFKSQTHLQTWLARYSWSFLSEAETYLTSIQGYLLYALDHLEVLRQEAPCSFSIKFKLKKNVLVNKTQIDEFLVSIDKLKTRSTTSSASSSSSASAEDQIANFELVLFPDQKNLPDICCHDTSQEDCPRRHGLVVRAAACEARGPGFDSSSRPNGFSPWAL